MIVRQDVCTERQKLPVPGQHDRATLTHGGFELPRHATMAEASVSVSAMTGHTASRSTRGMMRLLLAQPWVPATSCGSSCQCGDDV
jgi:hypothetical protein